MLLRWATLGGLVAVALGIAALATPVTRANGVPQLVKLQYLEGVSNWGPAEAEGLLEFSFAEGYARVNTKNLPAPDGMTLEGWMRNGAGDLLYVGELTTDGAGIGLLEAKLASLEQYDYTQFVVAARDGEPVTTLPEKISIAGNFTVIGEEPAQTDPGDSRPLELPNTGEAPGGEGVSRTFVAMMAMAVTGLAIVIVAQYRKRRRT